MVQRRRHSSVSSLLCECRACTSVSATEIKSCAGTAVKVSMKITWYMYPVEAVENGKNIETYMGK